MAAVKKMSLSNITTGKQKAALKLVMHAIPGVGKSTFAANMPKPIFLCAEDGTKQLDVGRFPTPKSYDEVIEALGVLKTESHDFKTLALDTLDWLEPLVLARVCVDQGKASIEDIPYGKGPLYALDKWRYILMLLDDLHRDKGMNIVALSHSSIRKMDDPATGSFDRYQMRMNQKAADLWMDWAYAVLFARHEVFSVEKKGKSHGVSSGERVMHTTWSAAFDAKNRFGLPETMPLSWSELERAINSEDEKVATLRAEVEKLVPELPVAEQEKARKALNDWAKNDPAKLSELQGRISAKLALATQPELGENHV